MENVKYGTGIESITIIHPTGSQDEDLGNNENQEAVEELKNTNLGLHPIRFSIGGQVKNLIIEKSEQRAGAF